MRRAGFTLIELLIGITIFTIISITVYSVFYMGIKTWRRAEDRKYLRGIRVSLLKIEKELKDSFYFSGIPFRGSHEAVVFPLTIPGEDGERVCAVTYSVSADKNTGLEKLERRENIYSTDEGQGGEARIKSLLSSMKSIRFEYAYKSDVSLEGFKWRDSWEAAALPIGVKLLLERDEGSEAYSKVIFLQQGELGER